MDMAWLFVSLVIGSVGLALFIYGKKQTRIPQLVVGILMMGYPYFVSNVWLMSGIAVFLVAGLWIAIRMGG
jgi:hypothetical protein